MPAAHADAESHSTWTAREDGRSGEEDRTFAWSLGDGSPDSVRFNTWEDGDGGMNAVAYGGPGPSIHLSFTPPAGQTMRTGVTYRVQSLPVGLSGSFARLQVTRDGQVCGRPAEHWQRPWALASVVEGTFRISELERDDTGEVTRLAATYELSCQAPGGQPGMAGSLAIGAGHPAAAVPDEPETPGPVTNLAVLNVGPDFSGVNASTLSWRNPSNGWGDTVVDMVHANDPSTLPELLGDLYTLHYTGRGSSVRDPGVDFMSRRVYRVTPRGVTGRLGPSTLLHVKGTRLDIPSASHRSTIGEVVRVSGRLTEANDYVDPADVLNGPAVVGRKLQLCGQSSIRYVADECATVDTVRTDADGRFTFSVSPMENTMYNVVLPASTEMVGNISRVINAQVAPHTDLRLAGSSSRRAGGMQFSTSRARAGSQGIVKLQRLDGRTWRTVATRSLKGRGNRVTITVRDRRPGVQQYRVVKPGDRRHVHGYSKVVKARTR
jgi:hypothetical protein